jgi:hypothetical protein
MTDMATAMGNEQGCGHPARQGADDPIKGISALSRVGLTFSDQERKVIESLVNSGDVAGAQKVILRELESEFGGTAAAVATAGDKFRTTFANFQEGCRYGLAAVPRPRRRRWHEVRRLLMDDVPAGFAAFKAAIAP